MKAWDSEFGYELVNDDVNLDFSAPNKELTDILQQAVDEAKLTALQERSAVLFQLQERFEG